MMSQDMMESNQTSAIGTPPVRKYSDDPDVQCTPYEHWVRRLYMTNLFNPVKLGLQNMQQLHDLLGNPMDKPDRLVIHIAGTNGKGSVTLKIAKTLEYSGNKNKNTDGDNLKVGLFVSPHVASFRERMQVNGVPISEEQVVEFLPRIYQLCQEHDIPATFFEITTALAFLFFEESKTDVVVLETGLGGRLDATNVIANPALSVITSIGLEHTRILGDTIELIAVEKAGIIKPTRPVLIGPNVPYDVVQQCAQEKKASQLYTCPDVLGDDQDKKEDEMVDYDLENARIATAALRLVEGQVLEERRYTSKSLQAAFPISMEMLEKGTTIRPPCRFEIVKRDDDLTVVLDVAHNPPAMEYLVQKLQATFPNRSFRMVVGMSRDKDTNLCGQYLLRAVEGNKKALHIVEAAHPRAATLENILYIPEGEENQGRVDPKWEGCYYDMTDRSVTRQIHLALDLARVNGEILVVCGSVFLMAEAREALGFDEPRDSDVLTEVAGVNLRHGQENFGNTTTPFTIKKG